MMLRHIGWVEAADLIISSLGAAISDKQVTYDLARLMEGAHEISTSAFAQAISRGARYMRSTIVPARDVTLRARAAYNECMRLTTRMALVPAVVVLAAA